MDLEQIGKIVAARDSLQQAEASPDHDPIKSLMLDGVSTHRPPGALMDFCEIIEKHYERRSGCEPYRIIGALGAAQAIVGRNLLTPTSSKIMFQMMLVARSGSGKTAALDFITAASRALGVPERVKSDLASSLKQIQCAIIEADGSLVYLVDDNEAHVLAWDSERSHLEGTSGFIRANSSTVNPWKATTPIRNDFANDLANIDNKKIEAAAKSEGWLIPRIDGTREIDFVKFSKQNQPIAKDYARAKRNYETACKPIERLKLIPVISLTPDAAHKILKRWKDNGSMGRTFFILKDDLLEETKDNPPEWKSRSFENEWKPRIPRGVIVAKWGDGAESRFKELSYAMDSLRNEDGITGPVSARYSQLIIDMATLCAFFDGAARRGSDVFVCNNHLEWAYQACLESMISMRNYHEGADESSNLESDLWAMIVAKVKNCVESNKRFEQFGTVAIIKDRLCRDKVKKIIDICVSEGMHMSADIFTYRVLECISGNKYAPVEIDENNTKKVTVTSGGRWSDVKMNNEIRAILSKASRRLQFMK